MTIIQDFDECIMISNLNTAALCFAHDSVGSASAPN